MKHCILAKFYKDYDWKKDLEKIKSIFDELIPLGVTKVEYITNCIDRENRFDLLIRITMDKEFLSIYDKSAPHLKWINTYAKNVEKKAIFDYED